MRGARRRAALPGFGLSLGLTLSALGLAVLIPLAALVVSSLSIDAATFRSTLASPRVVASLRLSLLAALAGGARAARLGGLVAWVLVRYPFPGRRLVDAVVALPFAHPTAVAGIAQTTHYGPTRWLGRPLAAHGLPGS